MPEQAATDEAVMAEEKAEEAEAVEEEKPEATGKAEAPDGKPILEDGVCGCFAVVSSAVRKGKGRGKGAANAAGGYIPAHLRDPSDAPTAVAAPVAAEGGSAGSAAGIATEEPAAAAGASTDGAGDGAAAQLGGASFDSLALSTSGSFDAEAGQVGDSGTSMRKRAKRWQRRGSTSAADLSAPAGAVDGGGASASACADAGDEVPAAGGQAAPAEEEPAAKRLKASPPPSPVDPSGASGALDPGLPPPSPGFPPPSPAPQGPATLEKLPASKLKSLARYHGVNITGCLEKAEMVAALRKAGLGDDAAEKEMQRERGGAVPADQQPGSQAERARDPRTEQEKENERKAAEHAQRRVAAKVAEAEERAKAAEAEARRLREELDASKTSSRKKWSPAFQSTPFIPDKEKDAQDPGFPPRSPSFNEGRGPGWGGGSPAGGGGGTFFASGVRPPQGGVDMRFNGGGGGAKGGAKGGAEFEICWEFKQGRCSKGKACKWKHN